jgi:hypothetical protein
MLISRGQAARESNYATPRNPGKTSGLSRPRVRPGVDLTVVGLFVLDGCEVVDRRVELLSLYQCTQDGVGQFEFFDGAERPVELDAFGLV